MDLEPFRKRIDLIDEKIQSLICERANVVREIAALKYAHRKPLYYQEREREILDKVKMRHKGPLSLEQMLKIFQEVLSACLTLEVITHEQNRTCLSRGKPASIEKCGR